MATLSALLSANAHLFRRLQARMATILPRLRGGHTGLAPNELPSLQEERETKQKMIPDMTEFSPKKVTVVGAGQVGMATAFCLLTQHITCNVTLIDTKIKRVHGEALDIDRGSVFLPVGARIEGSCRYEDSRNSDICVVATAAEPELNEKAEDKIQKNVNIFKSIIPQLLAFSPFTSLVIVSQPVDVMTYAAWRLSGLAANRVIGSGTAPDTAQFRTLIARRLGLAISDIQGWIIGEQGERSIPVWSGVNAAGVRLLDLLPDLGTVRDKEKWGDMAKDAVRNDQEIINLKGHSSWATALSISAICKAVLCNTRDVFSVSTLVEGHHGVKKDVFLSLPCVLYRNGIQNIVNQDLNDEETRMFQKSADKVFQTQRRIKF